MKRSMFAVGFALIATGAVAEGIDVTHDPPIGCLPVGQYSIVRARVPEATPVAHARTYFRRASVPETWFYIDLRQSNPTSGGIWYEGVLPKPTKELRGEIIVFYIEVGGADGTRGQTQEHEAEVVRHAEECKKSPLLSPRPAITLPSAHVTVFPSTPPGFEVGGVATAVVAPAMGAVLTGSQSAVAAEASSEIDIAGVEFYVRDLTLGTVSMIDWDTKPGYEVIWDHSGLCGQFEIMSRAIDSCGAEAFSQPVVVTLSCHH